MFSSKAQRLNERAGELAAKGWFAEAEQAYRAAAAAKPGWSVPWYNLGLMHKSLSSIAGELGGAAEDWSTSTRTLCKECSEGTPGHLHDVHSAPGHPHCGLAARDMTHARHILQTWMGRVGGGGVRELRLATGSSAQCDAPSDPRF